MLNLIHSLYMFRLFLIIISVFMISSCSNTQPPKKRDHGLLHFITKNTGHNRAFNLEGAKKK